MQKVSESYKASMAASLRERSYIMLSFGLINQEVQTSASVGDGNFADVSSSADIFGRSDSSLFYASLEPDRTRVDGSMLFPPLSPRVHYNTGLISRDVIADEPFSVKFDFNTAPADVKGLTIDFGETPPSDFDISSDTEQTIEVRDNAVSVYVTEQVFSGTSNLTVTVYKMKTESTRLRIRSVMFGYGLIYDNNNVIDSSLTSYVSPIAEDVPQIDFSVTLTNYDRYFDVDNPESAVNFLETGQEMDIYYGYQLPEGGIEWLKGNHLYCADWNADDTQAIIRCQDVFRSMDGEFYKGTYTAAGKSFYALAEEVLSDAGISEYYIDPLLKKLRTVNPLPRVTHREALQIIANACRCVLLQSRDGIMQIKSNFTPTFTAVSNGADVGELLIKDAKREYASLASDYATVDGKMYFMPRDENAENSGYISSELSDENGMFAVAPVITLKQNALHTCCSIHFVFGSALPAGLVLTAYIGSTLVDSCTVTENIERDMIVNYSFADFDVMTVEFSGTAEPNSRIVLFYIGIDDTLGFTMTKTNMTSYPKATKLEEVREVIVPVYGYQLRADTETLVSEEITASAGETRTFYFDSPADEYAVVQDGDETGIQIDAQGSYFVRVRLNVSGNVLLNIKGRRYNIAEQYATVKLRDRGKTVKWENPLISDVTMAKDLAEWLAEYYLSGIEYDYDTRGNPEVDANDIIFQENDFRAGMKVIICRETLDFKRAFSGHVTARRKGE